MTILPGLAVSRFTVSSADVICWTEAFGAAYTPMRSSQHEFFSVSGKEAVSISNTVLPKESR